MNQRTRPSTAACRQIASTEVVEIRCGREVVIGHMLCIADALGDWRGLILAYNLRRDDAPKQAEKRPRIGCCLLQQVILGARFMRQGAAAASAFVA